MILDKEMYESMFDDDTLCRSTLNQIHNDQYTHKIELLTAIAYTTNVDQCIPLIKQLHTLNAAIEHTQNIINTMKV